MQRWGVGTGESLPRKRQGEFVKKCQAPRPLRLQPTGQRRPANSPGRGSGSLRRKTLRLLVPRIRGGWRRPVGPPVCHSCTPSLLQPGQGMAPALGPTSCSSCSRLGSAPSLTLPTVGELPRCPCHRLALTSWSSSLSHKQAPLLKGQGVLGLPGGRQFYPLLVEMKVPFLRRIVPRPRSHSSHVGTGHSDSHDLTSHYPSPGWHSFIPGKTPLVS